MNVDVIIPCAGSARFIEETLTSVLGQSRKADAIYLVDNATEHAAYRTVAEKYASENLRYIRFEERLTLTLNWQRCLGVGSGDLCLMLHDDDTLLPDALETGVALLGEQSNASCALLPRIYQETDLQGEIEKLKRIDALPEPARSFYISTVNMNHMSALLFRRGPLGFYPQLRWMPDQGYIFAHAAQGRVALAYRSGAMIKTHDESETSALEQNGRKMVEERSHFRMAIDFFVEERGLTEKDIPLIAAIAPPYYLKRLLQACFSWPWRHSRIRMGREISRMGKMKEFLWRELGYGAVWPTATCLVTSFASDFRYFLSDKKLCRV